MADISNDVLLAVIQEKLEQILEQTTHTNERVTKIEEAVEVLEHWKTRSDAEFRTSRNWVFSIATVIGFIVGIIATKLWH